ncbi:hypothetical protein AB52_2236 [Escherichia coli 6-537-08_S1_C2]|nr:hypothetical protein EC178900_5092 [Escherichia coli 178900]END19721.1 hypothetical protein ECP03018678_5103 [Escherichia coli P0301867.8]KEN48462.1 hypothetical protein AB52_2236 [Escherichia coli 6-537-08_S1_C2]UUF21165.1 hypothetical protein JSMCR1_4154 [Escherichia coli]
MLCWMQYYIIVEFPYFLWAVMGCPASLHRNGHFGCYTSQLSSWL